MANEYLKRTPTSTGNRKVWTWSGWVERSKLSTTQYLFSAGEANPWAVIGFSSDDKLQVVLDAGTSSTGIITTAVYRDPSAWYHIVAALDTTQATNSNRIKLYVNGTQITTATFSYPALDSTWKVNSVILHSVGARQNGLESLDGYLDDIHFIDGQALTPDVFGYYKKGDGYISAGSTQATDFKKGQWVPKAPKVIRSVINAKGGFGVNGFYLPMNDSSNFGADFHCEPNSIIKLKGEDFNEYPQPRNGAPETTDAYVSQLREDPFKDYLVLAIPGIKGGRQSGYGDYSADIKGSGINKVMTAVGGAGVTDEPSFYGSAISIAGSGNPVSYIETPASPDFDFNADDFTVEFWEYRDTANSTPIILDSNVTIYAPLIGYTQAGEIVFYATDDDSAGSAWDIASAVPFGPAVAGQWNHIALCRKGTQFYLLYNGVVTNTFDSSKSIYQFANKITIGRAQNQSTFDGKIQDLRVYKGVAKYTGGFDVPKPYTPVGIATWRAVPDTTANNFATWNPLNNTAGSLSGGNLTLGGTAAALTRCNGTVGVSTGKWYFETNLITASNYTTIGIGQLGITAQYPGQDAISYAQTLEQGSKINNNSQPSYGVSLTSGDIFQVAFDLDNSKLFFGKNGTWMASSDPSAGTNPVYTLSSGTYTPIARPYDATANTSTNFGQNPSFSGQVTAGTFTDSNGKGLFKYQPPSGFLALCEDNLPTPAIKNPGEHFKTVLYAGDGNSGRSIVGVGFTPDLVWIKNRTTVSQHTITDSVRGVDRQLFSTLTNIEQTSTTGIMSLNADGFSLGTNVNPTGDTNGSAGNYVAWCWKAGGPAVPNTDGTIASQVSANQTAGFSIVSTNGSGTAGHGLNTTPKFIIQKRTDSASDWSIQHHQMMTSSTGKLLFSTAGVVASSTPYMFNANDTTFEPTYTTACISYCWAEIEGFSKFGSFSGNSSTDGVFVYTGHRPAFVMIKRTDSTGNWVMHDNARNSTNPAKGYLLANSSGIEEAGNDILDFLSNGFKIRTTWTDINQASGGTYIFAAFAESPFKTANAK